MADTEAEVIELELNVQGAELLEEQRATRMAVESIRVGDDTIAAAVDRHQVRMAMMRGY